MDQDFEAMDEVVFTSETGSQPKKRPSKKKSAIALLIGLTAVFLIYHTNYEREVHQQNLQAAELVKEIGGNVTWNKNRNGPLFFWSAPRVHNIFFHNPQLTGLQWQDLQKFPEPVVIRIVGSQFGDQEFAELMSAENIRHIVLAGTAVSDDSVARYQQIHPDVSFEIGRRGWQKYDPIPSLDSGMRFRMRDQ